MLRGTSSSGFTIIEMLITMIVLGVTFALSLVGISYIRNLLRQQSFMGAEREANVLLYNMTRDVRNAKDFIEISSGTLSFRVFNVHLGYDSATSLIFDPVAVGTITYQFQVDSQGTYLDRLVDFPAAGGLAQTVNDKKFLRNMLLTPDTTNYIFQAQPAGPPPYEGAVVVLRLGQGNLSKAPRIYTTNVLKRTMTN